MSREGFATIHTHVRIRTDSPGHPRPLVGDPCSLELSGSVAATWLEAGADHVVWLT